MIFDDYGAVDSVCYDLKIGDYPRAIKRGRINNLFNGVPPHSAAEVEEQNIKINFNDLTATLQGHDARSQLYSAFNKPGNYFTLRTDMGPEHKRATYGVIVTKEMNRIMKRSLEYYECYRSSLALDVLHGIGPACWDGPDRWCPDPLGIEDVLVPAGVTLPLRNMDRFALYRSYSWPELVRLTSGPELDPGWNTEMLASIKAWFKKHAQDLMGQNWPMTWNPDKVTENFKEDTGYYAGDRLPTIDVFDFYFWCDEKKSEGWYRRIILDSYSVPTMAAGGTYTMSRKDDEVFKRHEFLYTSGNRKIADSWKNIVSFQFADLSAVGPFRYHSIRSLGWLLYAPCMVQNLLRCKFNEHVFENLMQYFRVRSLDDYQRALKVELINRGFIDETVQMIPQNERWQINQQLVDTAFLQWDQLINRSGSAYKQRTGEEADRTRKTAYQVQTEVTATAGLVSTAFEQAYRYQTVQYEEDKRRFMRKDSTDPDVNRFRANCLRQGVPEKMLNFPEAWDCEPERVQGAGNKTIELAIANWLMEHRNVYDPEPQRDILRQATLMITDDPAFTQRLVPEKAGQVTDSVHDAQLAAGVLMQGLPVSVKTGLNHIEYVETLLGDFAFLVKGVESRGGMASPQEIQGFQNIAQHIQEHIAIIAQDPNEKQRVKQYGDELGQLMNMVKAYAQRLQEAMQKQQEAQGGNGQMDPKDMAKIQATMMTAQAKVKQGMQSHAQRTAQRQIQFEQQQRQQQQKHAAEIQALDLQTAAEIKRERVKAENEPNKKQTNEGKQ